MLKLMGMKMFTILSSKVFVHLYTKLMNMSEIIHQNEKARLYENKLRPVDKNA